MGTNQSIIGPAPAISRLGIIPYQWRTVCDHGDVQLGPATSFPQSIGMVTLLIAVLLYILPSA
jgi:hypothetical protein